MQYLIPGIWGNLFQELNGSSCTFMGDFLIFGNNQASLEKYIDQVMSENVINKNSDYHRFAENLSDQATLCYYFNTTRGFSELQSILSENLNKEINPSTDTLKKFKSFGVQIINNGDNFITNLFFTHYKTEQSKGPLSWQTALDTLVSGKPQIFLKAINGNPSVVAFDLSNTMYLLDRAGSIQWKLKLPGKPMGEVCEIHLKKSDSIFFVFNTRKHICIVDKNGFFAYNSPFLLPLQSVSGLACFESSSTGNYHIYLQLEDKKIYAFGVHGKQQSGWEKPSVNEFIEKPVQLLTLRGKEFFFLTSRSGQVMITDNRGRLTIKPGKKSLFSTQSLFYLNKTNNKGDFITSSNDGKLLYLRTDGKTSYLKFNNFTPDHVFYYSDIDNDKIPEFIYFDLNKVYCYNRFQKLLFNFTFPTRVVPPFMMNSPSGEILMGTVSPKTGDIYLFGKKGLLTIDPAIRGNTPFDLQVIDPDQGTSLVIGAGKYIKNWLLAK
jgi:succinate dehydrogenase flavin-adding protein (antitoxin of CptAB toxin-antitoxin module)